MQNYRVNPYRPSRLRLGIMIISLGMLTSIFSVVTMVVIVTERLAYPDGYADPFTELAGIQLGQPIESLNAYACEANDQSYRNSRFYTCSFDLQSAHFKRVVVGTYDRQITSITLTPHNLWVYDLIQRWGQPDHIRHDPAAYVLLWDEGVMAFTTSSQQKFTRRLAVKTLTLSVH